MSPSTRQRCQVHDIASGTRRLRAVGFVLLLATILGRTAVAEDTSNNEDLRDTFEAWMVKFEKTYPTAEEKEHRFSVWKDNHFKTMEKNKKHGPCKITGKKEVFGSTKFQDLTREEFQNEFLTGYHKPRTESKPDLSEEEERRHRNLHRIDKKIQEKKMTPTRHEEVHRRYLETTAESKYVSINHWEAGEKKEACATNSVGTTGLAGSVRCGSATVSYGDPASSSSCRWYQTGCWLARLFRSASASSTPSAAGELSPNPMQGDSIPSSFDWRDMGVVTDVRSQGSCGGCWGITATETLESAYAMSSGNLYELAEAEVILCIDSCMMCYGGWPQNAYEYMESYGGLPLRNEVGYDDYTLMLITMVLAGESDYFSVDSIENYMDYKCPFGSNYESTTRYGQIDVWGYSTAACVCYTDGSGCDCDEQDEVQAIVNIYTYGPATVCFDASEWHDYEGGVMTSSMGCSAQFLSMNHCAQAVGYVITDSSSMTGYWIIRNEWGENWGYDGYAYVALGYNTCGIANDMTQIIAS